MQLSLDPTSRAVAAAERRDALATVASLRPLLEPASVAIVGASRNPHSLGRRVLRGLTSGGFRGPIYPINPQADELDGARCYRSLAEIPRGVDLAVIAVPRGQVLGVVDECAAAAIKGLVVITAGFAEGGDEGRRLQQQLVERVRGHGLRMVGPNCMGLLNAGAGIRLNASFSPIVPPPGRVAFSSQSGALGLAILELATARGVGLSTFVSVGNKADVSGNDLLQYWEADPTTNVILLYLESFGNPRKFARIARRVGRTKPIVAIKSGRSTAGDVRAPCSRFRRPRRQCSAGSSSVIALRGFSCSPPTTRRDVRRGDVPRRAAVAGRAAGGDRHQRRRPGHPGGGRVRDGRPADRAVRRRDPRPARRIPCPSRRASATRWTWSLGGAAEYRRAIEVALTADEADALIVIYTPVDPATSGETLQAIRDGIAAGRAAGATAKPILTCLMADGGRPQALRVGVERVPAFAFPENAARALAKVAAYAGGAA